MGFMFCFIWGLSEMRASRSEIYNETVGAWCNVQVLLTIFHCPCPISGPGTEGMYTMYK